MSEQTTEGVEAPKRRAAKTLTHKPAEKPKGVKVKANLSLEEKAWQRLFIHSVMVNRPAGVIVEELIRQHLRDFALPADLRTSGKSIDRHDVTSCVTESDASPALSDAA